MTALRVTDLTVAYGPVVAVRDLSFAIEAGETLVLLGPNGAGKTSAVEAVAGLLPKRRGKVEFLGQDISALSASAIVRRGLALVPQWRELFRSFTVEETLLAATKAAVGREPTPLASIYELFPVLNERRAQTAGSLSGGEQQMLAISRALVTNPKLLLLDEPSLGLAPIIVEEVVNAILHFRDHGVTILLVEQNAELALALAARGYVIETGRIALADSSRNLLENPQVWASYLGDSEFSRHPDDLPLDAAAS